MLLFAVFFPVSHISLNSVTKGIAGNKSLAVKIGKKFVLIKDTICKNSDTIYNKINVMYKRLVQYTTKHTLSAVYNKIYAMYKRLVQYTTKSMQCTGP